MFLLMLCLLVFLALGGSTAPPPVTTDACSIFDHYPQWFDYAEETQQRWGTPAPLVLAIIKRESSFRQAARPPRDWFLFLPLPRRSSAYGYAQAQDPVWGEYLADTEGIFRSRTDMADAMDFIGWFTRRIHEQLGVPLADPYRIYLAYHLGVTGYREQRWRRRPAVRRAAGDVARWTRRYAEQIRACKSRFQCRRWYEIGPFCDAG
ncbi:MAG: hypothetical protein PVH31_10330 [Ectothiorhodospiraceae bacterium]